MEASSPATGSNAKAIVADELRAHCPKLGADRDPDGPGLPALDVLPYSLDEDARVRVEAAERELAIARPPGGPR